MELVVFETGGFADSPADYECHKKGCSDVAKKLHRADSVWYEPNLEVAEANFNEDLGVENGYDPPWVWDSHVKVFDCARKAVV